MATSSTVEVRRLAEIATIERNGVTAAAIEDGTTYVGLEHINSDGHFVGVRGVSAGELASSKFRFGPRHILFGKLRPYLTKTARPDFKGICSTDIVPILPGPRVDRDYLFHFLRYPKTVEKAVLRCTGANLPRLSPRDLGAFEVPIPPLHEQRRIADILDRADAIRYNREKSIGLAEGLLRSKFVEMFGDPIHNPRGWECAPIGDLARVTTGNTPPRSRRELYGNDLEWIKSDNINTPNHIVTRAVEGLSAFGRQSARLVGPGATLVTCIAGSAACIGNSAMTDREVAFNQQINALEPRKDVDPYFLYTQTLVGKRLIQGASTNAMKGMVSKSRLESVMFIKPPSELQRRFGAWFERWCSLRRRIADARNAAGILFGSLSQRAFLGEQL